MRLSVIKAIKEILSGRFKYLLTQPELERVNYQSGRGFESYDMMQYSINWCKFAKLVDNKLKEQGEPLGIFSRRHSNKFLFQVMMIVNDITAKDVVAVSEKERFRSWMD